ncbi:hypothetical protein NKH60_30740 [Mesorhizobium sp. M1006]|uniref:hypothetical protein n=1 Tax=Mesorhizobium sp. M1006 TaxID=2957048 RepID=UPI00333936E1
MTTLARRAKLESLLDDEGQTPDADRRSLFKYVLNTMDAKMFASETGGNVMALFPSCSPSASPWKRRSSTGKWGAAGVDPLPDGHRNLFYGFVSEFYGGIAAGRLGYRPILIALA